MIWLTFINYGAWYVFIFISIFWILTLLKNREHVAGRTGRRKYPSLSVIIPAHNEEDNIEETVKSISKLNYPKRLLEIIVVNDGSTDNTKNIAMRLKKKYNFRLFNNKINKGKGHALNRGIRAARGEFIACMDADSIIEKDIMKKMLPYFDDPKVGSVTPSLKVWKKGSFLEKMQHAEYILNIFLRKMLSFIDAVHVTPGVFSVYRKSVLREVGGFDEHNLTEDMDIALRIHKAGHTIENNIEANSYTLCPNSWKTLFKQRIRWYRGALNNYYNYRHMLFNRKYGNLGIFFLPANIIAITSLVVIFAGMAWGYMRSTVDSLWKINLVDWDVQVMLGTFDLESLSLIIATPLILGIIGVLIGGFVLYKSFKMTEGGIKEHKPTYLIYLLVFPLIMMLFWILAIFHEVAGMKKKW